MGLPPITKRQEQAYRLCHHEFGGLSQTDAAKKMNISQPRVNELLAIVRQKAPQLFPILTATQDKVLHMVLVDGFRYFEVAEKLGITISAVGNCVAILKEKGVIFAEGKTRGAIRFEEYMSDQVKEKF